MAAASPASLVRRFLRDRQGSYAILLALFLIPLLGAVGLAVDSARGYMIKSKLSYALDAAALAAGQLPSGSDAQTEIDRFFAANFPTGYMGATLIGPTYTEAADGSTLSVTAEAQIDTTFMRLLGFETLDIGGFAEISRGGLPLDMVLSFDLSGSMGTDDAGGGKTRIEAARDAANALLDAIYGSEDTVAGVKVGIVPWSSKVNVTRNGVAFNPSATTSSSVASFNNPIDGGAQSEVFYANNSDVPLLFQPTAGWPGCVFARFSDDGNYANDGDAALEPGTFNGVDWPAWEPTVYGAGGGGGGSDDDDDDGGGGGGGASSADYHCLDAGISPLRSTRSAVSASISDLTNPDGFTDIAQGLVWAWRVVMPQVPFTQADSDPNPVPSRVIVLLTDGAQTSIYYDAYKGGQTPDELDNRLRAIASQVKAAGIEIITIQFANSGTDLQTLMQEIASSTSSPHYFYAPDAAALESIFQDIGDYVARVHLSR